MVRICVPQQGKRLARVREFAIVYGCLQGWAQAPDALTRALAPAIMT